MTHALEVPRRMPRVPTRSLDRVVRLLAEDGARLADPEWEAAASRISGTALLGMYEDMVVVRSIDTTATSLQRQGELALWPPLLGQEAAQVGSARMLDPGDFGKIQEGDVLVTRSTSTSFNVVIPLLGAIVTDRGGQLSHAAIVAREYGIPGVVGTKEATAKIPDGARVRVDGGAGEVTILPHGPGGRAIA